MLSRTAHTLQVMVLGFLLLATLPLAGCENGCPSQPSGPATRADGPITIATDHSLYASEQTVEITITNSTTAAIQTPPWYYGCRIAIFERQVNSDWRGVPICPQSRGDTLGGRLLPIRAGASETDGIELPTDIAAGTYRVLFLYMNVPASPPAKGTPPPTYTTVYSATFRICA